MAGETPVATAPLSADQPVVDLGEVSRTEQSHTFRLTNRTPHPLQITHIGQSCACMTPALGSSVLAPGGSTELDVVIRVTPKDKGAITRFVEELRVFVEQDDNPLILRVSGKYIPPLYYSSSRFNILLPKAGGPFQGRHDLHMNVARGVRVTDVASAGLPVKATLGPPAASDNGYEKVVVQIEGTHDGGRLPQVGTLTVRTNSPDFPAVTLTVVLQTPSQDDIALSPDRFAMGIVAKGVKVTREVLLRIPVEGQFHLVKVETSHRQLTAVADPIVRGGSNDTLMVRCTLEAPPTSGAFEGHVAVHLRGGSGEQVCRIPVSGFVRN